MRDKLVNHERSTCDHAFGTARPAHPRLVLPSEDSNRTSLFFSDPKQKQIKNIIHRGNAAHLSFLVLNDHSLQRASSNGTWLIPGNGPRAQKKQNSAFSLLYRHNHPILPHIPSFANAYSSAGWYGRASNSSKSKQNGIIWSILWLLFSPTGTAICAPFFLRSILPMVQQCIQTRGNNCFSVAPKS